MKSEQKTIKLFDSLIEKATLKQSVYQKTLQALNHLKSGMEDLTEKYVALDTEDSSKIPFTYKDRGEFEAELKFAGDTLVFMMHTNIFELPRNHEVYKSSIEDPKLVYKYPISFFPSIKQWLSLFINIRPMR